MAKLLAPLQGRATVSIDVPSAGGTLEPLLRPDEFSLESSAAEDSVGTWRTWTLRIAASSRSVYESRIVPLLLSRERNVRVRWGVDTGSDVSWSTPESCRVLQAPVRLQNAGSPGSGCPFDLVLAGPLYEMDLETRVVARSGRVSEIVEAIAAGYGLESLVEPTGGVPLALVQGYQTDLEFIRRRLVPAAVNAAGAAGYYLHVEGGVLHFHTRDWKQEPWVVPYSPGASNLLATDDAQQAAAGGGAGARIICYDPLAGRTQVSDADPSRYAKLGRRLSAATGAALLASHAGPNQVAFEAGRAQALYAFSRDRYERINFTIANALDLRAGIVVTLQLPDANDSAVGYYFVEKVSTTVQGGAALSTVTASRGEVMGGRQSGGGVRPAASTGGAIPAPFDAPGSDPNFSPASQPVLGSGPSVAVRPSG